MRFTRSAHSVLEGGLGAGALDGLFDDLLHLIPVVGVDTLNVASEMLLDLAQHLPLAAVGDK